MLSISSRLTLNIKVKVELNFCVNDIEVRSNMRAQIFKVNGYKK